MPVDPVVNNDSIDLFMNATLYDSTKPYKVPTTVVSELEIGVSQKGQIVVDASTYSVDSLLSVV